MGKGRRSAPKATKYSDLTRLANKKRKNNRYLKFLQKKKKKLDSKPRMRKNKKGRSVPVPNKIQKEIDRIQGVLGRL